MTFDFTENSSPVIDREDSSSPPAGRAVLPLSFSIIKETYNEEFERQRWENEGGADPTGTDSFVSRYGLAEDNPIIQMVDDALDQLEEDDFDEAVKTVTSAMQHAVLCHNQVRELVRYAIDRLSTLGHPADPPHSGALALVKQKQNLAL